jgi:SAM-dependent methyltransferase
MGLGLSTVDFLLKAHARGISFTKTLTIGRTQLYLSPLELRKLARVLSATATRAAEQTEYAGFADDFLKAALDIETLKALDVSSYQGAGIAHDLNLPLPPELRGQWDCIIDAGTLEHVFNFPVAIKNYMQLVRPGGRLFIMTVANNHCGHGFYQFSPEVFFRLFNNCNGFRVERLLLLNHPFPGLELSPRQTAYSVRDPNEVHYRVGLVTSSPVMMLLEAERVSVEDILTEFPQQSDYSALWQRSDGSGAAGQTDNPLPHRMVERLRHFFHGKIAQGMPFFLRRLLMWGAGLYQRHFLYSLGNRKYYRRVRPFWSDKRSR